MNNNLMQCRQQHVDSAILFFAKEKLKEHVQYLRTLKQPVQKSNEWFSQRKEMLTASSISSVLNNGFKSRKDFLIEKSSNVSSFNGNFYTRWGQTYESVASNIYQKMFNVKTFDFGLIQHPVYPFLGASPDGITEDGVMLEIKCPPKREITGNIPEYYYHQIQLQLECCDLDVCDFLECQFEQYANRKNYLEDNNFNVLVNLQGKNNEFLPIHCDSFLGDGGYTIFKGTRSKTEIEIQEEKDPKKDDNIIYWKLLKMSCISIKRDAFWFKNNLPAFISFWKEVLFLRKNPEEIKKLANAKKNKSFDINLDTGQLIEHVAPLKTEEELAEMQKALDALREEE